jgi:adenylate cyclase class 2
MTFEVELKFSLADRDAFVARLAELDAQCSSPFEQHDCYWQHPGRDFGQTDEALRIRTAGDANVITYKGPLVDAQTKTRREIEIPIGTGRLNREKCAELFHALGFGEFYTVAKQRQPYRLFWEDRDVEVVIDDVVDLGSYVEIEALADEEQLETARSSILRLADRLGLENSIRKSYLCLLREKNCLAPEA